MTICENFHRAKMLYFSMQNGHVIKLVMYGRRAWKICCYQAQHCGVGCSMRSEDLFPTGCHLIPQLTWTSLSQHVPARQGNVNVVSAHPLIYHVSGCVVAIVFAKNERHGSTKRNQKIELTRQEERVPMKAIRSKRRTGMQKRID